MGYIKLKSLYNPLEPLRVATDYNAIDTKSSCVRRYELQRNTVLVRVHINYIHYSYLGIIIRIIYL